MVCPGDKSPRWIVLVSNRKKVKQEYGGVGPHAATIRRYVNANLQGVSPLKIGVKGDIEGVGCIDAVV